MLEIILCSSKKESIVENNTKLTDWWRGIDGGVLPRHCVRKQRRMLQLAGEVGGRAWHDLSFFRHSVGHCCSHLRLKVKHAVWFGLSHCWYYFVSDFLNVATWCHQQSFHAAWSVLRCQTLVRCTYQNVSDPARTLAWHRT